MGGGTKKIKYKSSENDHLTGHFQSSFFNIFRKNNSKTNKVNGQYVFNL